MAGNFAEIVLKLSKEKAEADMKAFAKQQETVLTRGFETAMKGSVRLFLGIESVQAAFGKLSQLISGFGSDLLQHSEAFRRGSNEVKIVYEDLVGKIGQALDKTGMVQAAFDAVANSLRDLSKWASSPEGAQALAAGFEVALNMARFFVQSIQTAIGAIQGLYEIYDSATGARTERIRQATAQFEKERSTLEKNERERLEKLGLASNERIQKANEHLVKVLKDRAAEAAISPLSRLMTEMGTAAARTSDNLAAIRGQIKDLKQAIDDVGPGNGKTPEQEMEDDIEYGFNELERRMKERVRRKGLAIKAAEEAATPKENRLRREIDFEDLARDMGIPTEKDWDDINAANAAGIDRLTKEVFAKGNADLHNQFREQQAQLARAEKNLQLTAAYIEKTQVNLEDAVRVGTQNLATGFANQTQAVISGGKNVLEATADFFGDMLIAEGQYLIERGVAKQIEAWLEGSSVLAGFITGPAAIATGVGLIAAGAGIKALGSAASSATSGASASSSRSIGGGGIALSNPSQGDFRARQSSGRPISTVDSSGQTYIYNVNMGRSFVVGSAARVGREVKKVLDKA